MNDSRLTPNPAYLSQSRAACVAVPFSDLCRSPNGRRDRQLLFGDAVTVLGAEDDWAYIQSQKDGYCGFIREKALGGPSPATHSVSAPATTLYQQADIKSPDVGTLSFGCRIRILETEGAFAKADVGYVPRHLLPRRQ